MEEILILKGQWGATRILGILSVKLESLCLTSPDVVTRRHENLDKVEPTWSKEGFVLYETTLIQGL